MLLHIIARGRIARSPEGELVDRYLKRFGWPHKMSELPDSGGRIPPPAFSPSRTILLDETGDMLTSVQLANQLQKWRDDGVREARFCLGAADGFTAEERAGADRMMAFGRATWPHLMARAMLAEQLYRATTIIAGHPYHREGMR
jgi:23S rRNA (pseudouridine1915-N3)-methyltransferase